MIFWKLLPTALPAQWVLLLCSVLLRVPQLCYNKSFSELHQPLLWGRPVIFPNVLHHIFGCAGQVVAVLVMTQMMALAGHDLDPAELINYAHPEEVNMAQGLGRQG